MYETGLGVALLWWLWSSINLLVSINSRTQRNLRRVGMRLSMVSLESRQMSEADWNRSWIGSTFRFLLVTGVGLALTLLSWVYVFCAAATFVYRLQKRSGRPAAVREFEWKLRNLDLSFDQIAKEMYALHSTIGLEQPEFEEFKADLWQQTAR